MIDSQIEVLLEHLALAIEIPSTAREGTVENSTDRSRVSYVMVRKMEYISQLLSILLPPKLSIDLSRYN